MGSEHACGYENKERPIVAETYSEPSQTSKIKLFAKIDNSFKQYSNYFVKTFILDI